MKQKGFAVLVLIMIITIGIAAYYVLNTKAPTPNKTNSIQNSTKNGNSDLVFVTYDPEAKGYRTLGETAPPAGWIYWKINAATKKIQILDKNNEYFKEFEQDAKKDGNVYHFNFSKALNLKNGLSEQNKLRSITDRNNSNFLVQVYRNNKFEVWKFNPTDLVFTQITAMPSHVCIDQIIDWDSENGKLLGYTWKQSLTDSSSSDISNICIYDYKNEKILLNYQLPVTKQIYYSQASGTLESKKVVLRGSDTVILDLDTQKEKSLKGYDYAGNFSEIRYSLTNGRLPVEIKKDQVKEVFSLSIYSLKTETFSDPINFNRIPADEYIYDNFQAYVLDSNNSLIEYDIYKPRSTCWYFISNSNNKEKLFCTYDKEIYSKIYPQTSELSSLTTSFVKWYK